MPDLHHEASDCRSGSRAVGTFSVDARGEMKSCLIVDDSKVIRMVARKILQDLQFDTVEAADGSEALDACKSQMPDAVLLDWNMPVMDGLEFLKEMRKLPGGEVPIVVFCTIENDLDHIQVAIEAGANEYIMKPFDSEIIQTKFAQVGLL
jgi:two-component system chemotaxis response regulator CheY